METMPINWLLEGDPWVQYRTLIDLLNQSHEDSQVQSARAATLAHPGVLALIAELANWPGTVLSSHKSASQSFHKLNFLADLGLTASDPGMEIIITRILSHQSPEGPFQLTTNVPVHFGGSGQDQWAWALCDAPLIVYALNKFGLSAQPQVSAALAYMSGLARDNGWPCAVSKELGKFRGPGRKEDPCPFATLAMLKVLSTSNTLRRSEACRTGAETLLNLWQHSLEQHPYIFYMGDDFRKLKAPLVWYDLLHVLDVLSNFDWLFQDPRLRDMLAVLRAKADPEGRFTAESIWTAWKGWEFGQKKAPSRWITFLAWRIIQRITNGKGAYENQA